jgi:hypothetical protein
MGYIGLIFAACMLLFVKEPMRTNENIIKEKEIVKKEIDGK